MDKFQRVFGHQITGAFNQLGSVLLTSIGDPGKLESRHADLLALGIRGRTSPQLLTGHPSLGQDSLISDGSSSIDCLFVGYQ